MRHAAAQPCSCRVNSAASDTATVQAFMRGALRALQAFTGCASAANGDVRAALCKTFAELDSVIAGGSRRVGTSRIRPVQRCAGVMIVIDLRSGVSYTASTAAARSAAALCSVLGAFNSESSEGHLLRRPHGYLSSSLMHACARKHQDQIIVSDLSSMPAIRDEDALPRGGGAGGVVVTAQKLSFEHKQIVVGSGG